MSIVSGSFYVEQRWYYILKSDLNLSLATFSSHSLEEHKFIGIADEEHKADIESFSDKDLERLDTSWINFDKFIRVSAHIDIEKFIDKYNKGQVTGTLPLKPASVLYEEAIDISLENDNITRKNIIEILEEDARKGYFESLFVNLGQVATTSWSDNTHVGGGNTSYINSNLAFREELTNMGYKIGTTELSYSTPLGPTSIIAQVISWDKED